MIALTDAFALLGTTLAVYAGCLTVLYATRGIRFRPHYSQIVLTFLVLFIVLVPTRGQFSIAFYIRGFSSDLSMTLVALSVWSICYRFGLIKPVDRHEFQALMVTIAPAALLLYPTALGWGDWDAYRLGWGSWQFLLALLVLCGVSASMGLRVLPALIALALLAWSVGLMESGNLWDYLVDPWLSAFALGYVVNKFFIKCLHNARHRLS